MLKRGKNITNAKAKLDIAKKYSLEEALGLALSVKFAKFDESIDVAIRLGVDPRQADHMVRGSVMLPHGLGKKVRVVCFAQGEKEKEARDAGADYVGGEDLVDKIKDGWLEFDKAIATPDMMKSVGRIAKVLGPRGLMPNPKTGTVTTDLAGVIKEIKTGKVDFKVEKAGIIHAVIGKASFGVDKLKDNFLSLFDRVLKLKPSTSKGVYVKGVSISTTHGAGVKVDTSPLI